MRVLLDTSYADARPVGHGGVPRAAGRGAARATGDVDVVEARQRRAPPARGRQPAAGAPSTPRSTRPGCTSGLPRAARAAGADVVHHPLPALSPPIARAPGGDRARRGLRGACPRATAASGGGSPRGRTAGPSAAAARVVCVSEATARTRSACSAPTAAAGGGPSRARAGAARAAERRPPRHFLYVGDAEPRKGVPALLDAYAALPGRARSDPLVWCWPGAAARRARARAARRGRARPRAAGRAARPAAAALVHPSLPRGLRPDAARGDGGRGARGGRAQARASAELGGDAALLVAPGELAAARWPDARDAGPAAAAGAGGRRAGRGVLLGGVGAAPRALPIRWPAGTQGRARMNVAILGTRGIPASYSGFETAVEQITSRLTARGHRWSCTAARTSSTRDHALEGRRAGAPPHGAQQVPGHVRAHPALERARGAHGSSPTSPSSSSPATARCAWSPGSRGSPR